MASWLMFKDQKKGLVIIILSIFENKTFPLKLEKPLELDF